MLLKKITDSFILVISFFPSVIFLFFSNYNSKFFSDITNKFFVQDISTYYFYNYLSYGIFLFLIIYYKSKLRFTITFFYLLLLNLTLLHTFNADFQFLQILIPYSLPESSGYLYLINNLVYIFLITDSKNLNIAIIYTYFLTFLIPDFLFIFIIYFLFINKEIRKVTFMQEKILLLLPFIFYLLRIFTGIFKNYDQLWLSMAHSFYHGKSRFDDMFRAIYSLYCNKSIDCDFNHYGKYGPLNDLLYLNNLNNNFSIYLSIFLILNLLIVYYFLIFKTALNKWTILFLFLSPPLNFLTFISNIDLLIFAIVCILLKNYEKSYILSTLLIMILSLYKIHASGILLGLVIYFLINNNFKIAVFNLISLFIELIISIYYYRSKENIFFNYKATTFGVINDASVLEKYTSLNFYAIYLIILFFIIFFALYFFKKQYIFNQKLIVISNLKGNLFFVSSLGWYMFAFLLENSAYRLPLFYIVFYYLITYAHKKISYFTIFYLVFSIPIKYSPLILQLSITIIQTLFGYIIFVYVLTSISFILIKTFKNEPIYN